MSGLPAIEEVGDGLGSEGAHVLELLVALGVEELAVGVEDGESRDTFFDGDEVLVGDGDVVVELADVDVDDDEVTVEELEVGRLMEVDVEDLAVAAPVSTEVEDDTLVLGAGLGEGGGDVGLGVSGGGIEVAIDEGERGLGGEREGRDCGEGGSEEEWRDLHGVEVSWEARGFLSRDDAREAGEEAKEGRIGGWMG
jgi:hypothetical protein